MQGKARHLNLTGFFLSDAASRDFNVISLYVLKNQFAAFHGTYKTFLNISASAFIWSASSVSMVSLNTWLACPVLLYPVFVSSLFLLHKSFQDHPVDLHIPCPLTNGRPLLHLFHCSVQIYYRSWSHVCIPFINAWNDGFWSKITILDQFQ